MKKSEQVRILGNLVRRREQLECISENLNYLLASKNHTKVGRDKEEIKTDLRRAHKSYITATRLLSTYIKKLAAETFNKNQQEETI